MKTNWHSDEKKICEHSTFSSCSDRWMLGSTLFTRLTMAHSRQSSTVGLATKRAAQRRYAEILLIFSRWDFTSLSANMYTLWLAAAALQFKLRSITIHTQYKTLFFYPNACSVVAVEELNFVRNKADDARQKHSWKWHHDRGSAESQGCLPCPLLFFLLFLCLSLSLNVARAKISNS